MSKKIQSTGMGDKTPEELKKISGGSQKEDDGKTKEERIQENIMPAVYRVDLLIFAPDNVNGAIMLPITLKSRAEFDRANKAIKDGKDHTVIEHSNGEFGRINFTHPVIYVTASKIEPEKKSGLIIASGQNIVSGLDPNKLRQ